MPAFTLMTEMGDVILTVHSLNLDVVIKNKLVTCLDSDSCCHGRINPSLMQMLCTATHAAVGNLGPWLWMSYCLSFSTVTGSRLTH